MLSRNRKTYIGLWLTILLAVFAWRGAAAGAEAAAAAENPEAVTRLTVGNATRMKGYFFTDLWGNDTADQDVRSLLHAYDLVKFDGGQGTFVIDTEVVSGITVLENEAGDRSYVFVLSDDLYYSDGTKITAKDYAFSILLQIAPELQALGVTPARKEQIAGYQDYVDGKTPYLSGVRITAEDTLLMTIDHESLPFFYEMGLLACQPYPIHVIAPGVTVKDDGEGVYLANEDKTVTEPVFTAALLEETILDEAQGYLSHPSVVSGPYTLTDWDGVTARFTVNPYYRWHRDEEDPPITELVYTLADNETMIDELREGSFDLLNKVTRAQTITDGMALLREEDSALAMASYPRSGMSFISFVCERDTVRSQAVRQAIAWCMDRDQITADYTGSYGLRVDGFYGLGQWMYNLIAGSTPPPVTAPADPDDREAAARYAAELEAYEALNLDELTPYCVDVDKAIALLEEDGWLYPENEETNGEAPEIRQKEIDGETVRLELTLAYPAGNRIAESFSENMIPYLAEAGISLTLKPLDMTELLELYNAREARDVDMIYLASNFETLYDPASYFVEEAAEGGEDESDEAREGALIHRWVNTGLADEPLYEAAKAMRDTRPGDVLTYVQHWISFEKRFNETLPMIPIYSNVYFDFYTDALHDYHIADANTWGQAIVDAGLKEPETPEAQTEAVSEAEAGVPAGDAPEAELVEFDD